ncbi:hypothetical protein [Treponema endosymbiont of Eucomonympha sp.]|uniref:hypothetical protein n=1 Tax=Treponema endosymbiont of Eucomonympha sp. TaxID=1580831 RepID=UPI00164EE297|nr:hypothetical protein [Treponema endosymbiont of Eucomonympha sp.]
MQSSPLPSSPPFMSGVCSSTFQSTLPRGRGKAGRGTVILTCFPPTKIPAQVNNSVWFA